MSEAYIARPLSPIRKVIAARMTEVMRTVPHFRLMAQLSIDALLDVRRKLHGFAPDSKLSLNDLLVKACASALMDEPAVNIQWVEGEIHQYHSADISVVTAIEGGLATPIVRSAQTKTVWEISRELKEFASRASRNALRANEVFGGTFSVSNLGMFGVDEFDAIINPPQCAIIAIGCAKRGYIFDREDRPEVATVLRATLSVDHRALDGASAAPFLSALRRRVEQPGYMLPERSSL